MMFWFKKNKITVDAFCKDPGVVEYNPIQSASKFLPDWWRKLDSTFIGVDETFNVSHKAATIKRCDGFISLYKKGFVLPLWTDMQIQNDDSSWNCLFSDGNTSAMSHNRKQYDSSVFDNLIHIKITSPWIIQEKTGCEFIWTSPWWNNVSQHNKFYIPPGIVEYKYQHVSNINIFINSAPNNFMIACGTPLAHIVPLSDKEVDIKCHHITFEEYNKKFLKTTHHLKFMGSYKEKKRIAKQKESKCPFGFGK